MSVIRRTMSPPFIAVAAVLLLAAATVHGVIWARGMNLIKQPVPLRDPLFLLERQLGPYERVEEHRLSSEELEEVGTEQYVLWTYQGRDSDGRPRRVHLFLAYHTGMPEARPRVPEQMHLVPGRATDQPACAPLTIPTPFSGRSQSAAPNAAAATDADALLCVRMVTPSGGGADVPVAYAFIVNGRMVGSRDAVHALWTDPYVSHAWWAKLEVRIDGAAEADDTREQAEHFLQHALPAIAELLPAYNEVRPGADER